MLIDERIDRDQEIPRPEGAYLANSLPTRVPQQHRELWREAPCNPPADDVVDCAGRAGRCADPNEAESVPQGEHNAACRQQSGGDADDVRKVESLLGGKDRGEGL